MESTLSDIRERSCRFIFGATYNEEASASELRSSGILIKSTFGSTFRIITD